MVEIVVLFCATVQFYLMKSVITLISRNISILVECLLAPGSFKEVQPLFTPIIRNNKINNRKS
jgi:hypothetical protein